MPLLGLLLRYERDAKRAKPAVMERPDDGQNPAKRISVSYIEPALMSINLLELYSMILKDFRHDSCSS